ncbi:hypothetical protein B0H11DRAFT_1349303 [Mycena galericulata]|nr:hypothetical protein B0H11DRAFT_1349303 [Mycena galericulata]
MTPANKRGNMFNPKLIPTYIACSTVKSNDLAKSESLQNIANPPPSRDPLFEIDPESSLPTPGDSGPAAFATHNIRSESLPPTRPVTPDPESREPEFRSLETLLRVQEPSFGGAIETEAEPTVQDRLKQDNEPSPDALSNAPHPALPMNAIAIEPSANLGVFERSTCPSPSRSTTQNISSSGSAPQARESAPGTSSEDTPDMICVQYFPSHTFLLSG